jgi:hypothetical protein
MAAVADTFAQFRKTLNKGFLNDRAGIAWQTTTNPNRNASVPYLVVRSSGLMTFPLDLDIFLP